MIGCYKNENLWVTPKINTKHKNQWEIDLLPFLVIAYI